MVRDRAKLTCQNGQNVDIQNLKKYRKFYLKKEG